MSRRRMIDPDIWEDEKFSQLDSNGKLLFIGLISLSNDYGKLRGNSTLLKNKIFPYETQQIPVEEYINKLTELGMIELYEVNNEKFIRIKNWFKYQTLTYWGKDNIPLSPIEIKQKESEETLKQLLTNSEQTLNKPLKAIEVEDNISKDKIKEVEDKTTASSETPKIILQTSNEESVILIELQKIPNYPFDGQKDLQFINSLKTDFPTIDILQEVKSWKTWLIDKPLIKDSNPRTKLRNWFKKAVEHEKQSIGRSKSVLLNEYYKHIKKEK